MKVLIGWLLGLTTAWAALAIWQRVPSFPDVDEPALSEFPDNEEWLTRNGEKPYVHLNNRFPPPPVIDPSVHTNWKKDAWRY